MLVKKCALMVMLALIFCLFSGCTSKEVLSKPAESTSGEDWGQLESFLYQYGSFHEGYWEYTITEKNGRLYLTGTGTNGAELDVHKQLSQQEIDGLTTVVREQNLSLLDGYNNSDDGVLDGYSFSLEIQFLNHSIQARAYQIMPEDYDSWHKALVEYLEKISH